MPTVGGEPASLQRLMEMIQGYWVSQIVATVARLGIADLLAERPRTCEELVEATGANPDALRRLLRGSATIGLLDELEPGRYVLTPVGAYLRSGDGGMRNFAIALTAPGLYRPVERLFDAVMTGRPTVEAALGTSIWEYYDRNPAEGSSFARAMRDISVVQSGHVVSRYPVGGFERIVDVGGGQGVLLSRMLRSAPAVRGVLFDLPDVIDEARELLWRPELAGRVELVAGDFFQSVPEGGDLYVLKHVLHDWDDERATQILTNCHRAARPDSVLLVVETLLPGGPGPARIHLLDVHMLVHGGRERSRDEYDVLLRASGYRLERIIPTPVGESLLEVRRT
jgi:hypothetical protein